MTQGGFLVTAGSRPRPLGLGIVIMAHVAVLAAIMLAKGTLIPAPPPPFVVTSYPDDTTKPPPPNPTHPKVPTKTAAEPTPLPIPNPVDPKIIIIDLPKFPIDPVSGDLGAGTGERTAPAPVLVDAQIDRRFAGDFQPLYPAAAQRDGISGKVTVRVRIGADGRVKSVELVRAEDPAFFEATERQAMRRWRFTPATRDGVAIESVKVLTVSFVLRD